MICAEDAASPADVGDLTPGEAIQAALAHLCTRPDRLLPDTWLRTVAEAGEADALAAAADRTMIAGLLWSALTPGQRDLLPEAACELLRNHHIGNVLRWTMTRKLLIESAASLSEAGIPAAPLKGAALLVTVYEDPGRRALTDLDLLVPEDALEVAQKLLSKGAAQVHQPRAEHHHLGAIIMPGAGGMIELHGGDAHAALWPQRGDVFTSGRHITLEGSTFIVPDDVNLWLHTACHGLGHSPCYWPRMAADLALLHRAADWSAERWEAVWQAARERAMTSTVAVAAAFANLGRIPAELREIAGRAIDRTAVEARAREAWGIATTAETRKFGPWATSWVSRNEQRRRLIRQYLLPPPARLSEKIPVSETVAHALYPCSIAFRCFELATTGLAWRLALRGRSFPEAVSGQ